MMDCPVKPGNDGGWVGARVRSCDRAALHLAIFGPKGACPPHRQAGQFSQRRHFI